MDALVYRSDFEVTVLTLLRKKDISHPLRWAVLVCMLLLIGSQVFTSNHIHHDISDATSFETECVTCAQGHHTPLATPIETHSFSVTVDKKIQLVFKTLYLQLDLPASYLSRAPPHA